MININTSRHGQILQWARVAGLIWGRFQLLLLPSYVQKAFEAWLLQSQGLTQEHFQQHWCQRFWKLAQLLGGLVHMAGATLANSNL